MRQIPAMLVIAILIILPLACAPQQVDMTALRKTVDAFNEGSKQAMLSNTPEKNIDYYESDAYEMAPNMPIIKGRDSILAFQQSMSKMGAKFNSVSFQTLDLMADGKVATEIGTYDMSMTVPSMGEIKDKGKYIAIWHQQADNTWKVHAETWNTDTPMPMPSKEEKPKGKK